MRNIRRQPREEVNPEEIIEKTLEKKKVKKQEYPKTTSSLNSIVAIMKLGLTANEIKLLEAIESEKVASDEDIPAMSTNFKCKLLIVDIFSCVWIPHWEAYSIIGQTRKRYSRQRNIESTLV